MPDKETKRRLTAIVSADVKGYSKLMGDDDESTVDTITAYRKIIARLVQKHDGRVVDSPGDNILAEFASAQNAVISAIEVQRKLEKENANLPHHRRMAFRIGINLGDILHKEDRIYGDGVNVAARIESLAEPGGICISRGVYDQVKNKVRQGFEYRGEHVVKNIPDPVRIYRILLAHEYEGKLIEEPAKRLTTKRKPYAAVIAIIIICSAALLWMFYPKAPEIEPASVENMAFPLPDKPSIAVLPLVNVSGDSNQDYFTDAITRNITTDLSRFSNLFVISSHSAFVYKMSQKTINEIGRELGVRFLLEGSLQRIDNRLRVNVELIDARTGNHIWAQKYEGETADIFATQDAITQAVVSSLGETIWRKDAKSLSRKPISNFSAFDFVLKGDELLDKLESPQKNQEAREFYEKAIRLDPELMRAHLGMGWSYFHDWLTGWAEESASVLAKAEVSANKAAALDDNDAEIQRLLGRIAMAKGHHDEGLAHMERALELNPNNGDLIATYSIFLIYLGRHKESLDWIGKAMRLNPHYPGWYATVLASGYYMTRKYKEAVAVLKRQEEHNFFDFRFLAASYGQMGQLADARKQVDKILAINPQFTLAFLRSRLSYKHESDIDHFLEGLRKAGLK